MIGHNDGNAKKALSRDRVTARELTHMSMQLVQPSSGEGHPISTGECRVREVLDRVGDKWSVLVIYLLGAGTRRFSELLRTIDGISQRMLTVTLRGLERDGLVTRTVYPVVPPRVDYALTPLGRTLLEAVTPLMEWSEAHTYDVAVSRAVFDAKPPSTP
jgi:DNA-binding HxlR family transcriptional regulator